jgi:tetratricopeptide (TPR) repeat protein
VRGRAYDTPAGVIVDEASSDPGLPGDPPVPVDANHVSIVKPFDRSSILYARTRDFIAKSHPVAETQEGALEIYPLPPIRSEQSPNIVPKLIRIAAIGLVALIGYKGVQALIAPAPTEQLAVKDAQIAAKDAQIADLIKLTKWLVEKNPGVAAPGAEQAVGAAVQSIAQGAEAGDSRLEQALALLKDNKIAEATQLLNAVAVDKTAYAKQAATPAEKDRKEAAAAYRNLGAIAALRDPKKALEAYAKAVELNPDDRESLYWHGWLSLLAGQLPIAEQSLERLLKIAAAAQDRRGIYRANLRLGELAKERGSVAAGLEYEEKAKDIAIEQAAAYPSDREWQRDLAVAYEKIGDMQKARGDLAGSLKFYNDDLTIAERLAKSDPRDARGQRDLSICYEEIGDVQMAQSDLKGALKTYTDSFAIMERLAQFDPASPGWQSDLSFAYVRIGNLQKAQGDLKAALKSYSGSLAIRARLAKSSPGNAGWQRDLSVSYAKLADAHRRSGDKAKARGLLRQGQAIMARLTKLSPDNAEWKQDLAWFEGQIKELER